MYREKRLFCLHVLLCALASSQCRGNLPSQGAGKLRCAAPAAEAVVERLSTPFFWKIEGTQGNAAYLLGCVCQNPGSCGPLSFVSEIESAFDRSTHLLVEVETAAPGKSMPGQAIGELESVDGHFLQQARAARKTVVGLETAEMQQALPAKICDAVARFARNEGLQSAYEKDLPAVLRKIDASAARRDLELEARVWELWKQGDEAALQALAKAQRAAIRKPMAHPKLRGAWKTAEEALTLYQRNEAMADKIAAYLEGGTNAFAAVGCLHLIGPKSIVHQLREKGYRATQLLRKAKKQPCGAVRTNP